MWRHGNGWNRLQSRKDRVSVNAWQLLALFIDTARTFLDSIVAAKNCSNGFEDGFCGRWDQQGGESAVIQVKLRSLRKRFPAARGSRCRQKNLFFHTDVSEQRSAELRVSRWFNPFEGTGGSLKSVFDACVILFQITRNCSCHGPRSFSP
jgi:hypothetical protein